jgi:hypothetical protein
VLLSCFLVYFLLFYTVYRKYNALKQIYFVVQTIASMFVVPKSFKIDMKTKNLTLITFTTIGLLFVSGFGFSQVGVGTTNPQETLHVNGTLRITNTNQESVDAIKIGGLDENGTYREIILGTNLSLKNNVISATSAPKYTFGSITLTSANNHNVDLLLDPGEANDGVNIIRVYGLGSSSSTRKITGIKAGVDGQVIWLYPQLPMASLELMPNNSNSLPANRILPADKMTPKTDENEMIKLIYDAQRSRWLVMSWFN